MPQPEWFGPMDKLSWQLGQMALLFDFLLAFGVSLLALALVALVIQLVGLWQLLRAEKQKRQKASPTISPVTKKSQPTQFRPVGLSASRIAPVRRKP